MLASEDRYVQAVRKLVDESDYDGIDLDWEYPETLDWVQWDDETKSPWLVSPDGRVVIGYDDAESVALKARWAREQGFRGVFFWQIAADRLPNESNPLQEAARKQITTPP